MNQRTSKESEEVESSEEFTFLEQDMGEENDSNLLCDVAVTEIVNVHGNSCKGVAAPDGPSTDGRSEAAEVDEETSEVTSLEGEEMVTFESSGRQSGRPVNPESVLDSSTAEQCILKADQQIFEDDMGEELASERLEANNKDSEKEEGRANDADEETIPVDEEATIIQNRRLIEGDKNTCRKYLNNQWKGQSYRKTK